MGASHKIGPDWLLVYWVKTIKQTPKHTQTNKQANNRQAIYEDDNYLIDETNDYNQGYNARTVISEVYASFVVQCNVSGR